MVTNIVHLMLAKIPDTQAKLPAGVKGISLFAVPKHLVDMQGEQTGERNYVAQFALDLVQFLARMHLDPRCKIAAPGVLAG